ncbi:pseudouridine synthase [Xanthobacter agilis]|uniref:Pseudouridine synthase n=1 Tax=Xanthobacter agilis TaxID=47492 RepID=A0ABU0LGM0_XANAG|nr:pseudouridine synthase [Xanthobacter agilis]MDQ0506268.1 23S rRNA pseudouridine2605 synthase [Xanthobacter agilis]
MPRTSPPRKDKNNVPRLKRELPAAPKKEAERVAKVVARAGLASRREIEEWIAQGRVAVNGAVLTSPAVTVTAKDTITVDGAPLPEKERTRLFLYHKPKGVVTTNRDPEGRATLFEILPKGLPRLVSIGRLDINSEGLLLLTNDGGLARVLELPETGWLRRYRVRANGEIDQAKLDGLIKGITVDGVEYGPIEAELDRVQGANAWITVSLREGKNREVRNVLGALGLKVNRLIRVSYGPFQLGEIPECGIEEVRTRVLREQIGTDLSAAAGADFDGPLLEREIEEEPDAARHLAARLTLERAERAAAKPRPAEVPAQDQFRTMGPRVRRRIAEDGAVESRGTVADRKGRAVKVERLTARPDEGPTRSGGKDFGRPPARGRRFEQDDRPGFRTGDERPRRPRGDGQPQRFGEDRPRSGKGSFGKGSFGNRTEGERAPRSFRPRDGESRDDFRMREDRPARGQAPGRGFGGADDREARRPIRGKEGFGNRAEGERAPRSFRPRDGEGREDFRRGERPAHAKGPAKGPGRFGGADAAEGHRPRGEGFAGRPERADRAPGGRGFAGKGSAGKSFGDRNAGGRSFGEKSHGDRPERSDRAPGGRGFAGKGPAGRSFGDRNAGDRSFGEKSHGDRPERSDRAPGGRGFAGKGPAGRSFGDRNAGDRSFGEKSYGDRPERKGPPKDGFKGGFKGGAPRGAGKPGGFGGRSAGGPKGGKPFGKGGGAGGGRPSAPRGKR